MFVVFFATSPTICANTKRNATTNNNNNNSNNASNKAQYVLEFWGELFRYVSGDVPQACVRLCSRGCLGISGVTYLHLPSYFVYLIILPQNGIY